MSLQISVIIFPLVEESLSVSSIVKEQEGLSRGAILLFYFSFIAAARLHGDDKGYFVSKQHKNEHVGLHLRVICDEGMYCFGSVNKDDMQFDVTLVFFIEG